MSAYSDSDEAPEPEFIDGDAETGDATEDTVGVVEGHRPGLTSCSS